MLQPIRPSKTVRRGGTKRHPAGDATDEGRDLPAIRRRAKQLKKSVKARRNAKAPVVRDTNGEAQLGKKGGAQVRRAIDRHREMREPSTQKIYDLHSKFYDATFGRLVRKRIGKAIVEQIKLQAGQVALDVGIGTGGSLEFWPSDAGTVIGVDLSGGMLSKAAEKIDDAGRENAALSRANALRLPFADAAFDSVFVSHVISVVSDPAAVLKECLRVAKPGARVVLVNHFQSENKVVGTIEKLVCPICTKLGWKSDLALQDLVRATGVTVEHRYKLTKPDLWETVVIVNNPTRDVAA